MIVTITNGKITRNVIIPNTMVSVIVDNETTWMAIHSDFMNFVVGIEIGKRYNVHILVTKDPTPCDALSTVSLGYFMYRWDFRQAVFASKEPAVFRGWSENQKNWILLEMWE